MKQNKKINKDHQKSLNNVERKKVRGQQSITRITGSGSAAARFHSRREDSGPGTKDSEPQATIAVLACSGIFPRRRFVVDLEGKPLSAAATLWPQPELHPP